MVRRLEPLTGVFDIAQIKERIAAGAPRGAITNAIEAMAGESRFMRFTVCDRGAVLRLMGQPADVIRFMIGQPSSSLHVDRPLIGLCLL